VKALVSRLLGGRGTKLAVIAMPIIVAGGMIGAPAASAHSSTAAPVAHTEQAASTSAQPSAMQPAALSSCPASNLCFWVNAGYAGNMGKFAGDNGWWGQYSQAQCASGTWNDCASSLYNHGNYDAVYVYQDVNGGGGRACVAKGTAWSNLTTLHYNNGAGLNDSITSNKWGTSASC
jgi:hypothetical protein